MMSWTRNKIWRANCYLYKKHQFTTLHLVFINQNLTELLMLLLTLSRPLKFSLEPCAHPHTLIIYGLQNLSLQNSYSPLPSLGIISDLPDVIKIIPCDKHYTKNLE